MNVRLDRQNPYLRIDAVNVYVRDQDRSLDFYLNQLGFHLALDIRLQSGYRLVAVAPPDGTTVLRLIAPDPDSEDYPLIGRATPIVFLTEDVVAKFREWSKRGVHFRLYASAEAAQAQCADVGRRTATDLGWSIHALCGYRRKLVLAGGHR